MALLRGENPKGKGEINPGLSTGTSTEGRGTINAASSNISGLGAVTSANTGTSGILSSTTSANASTLGHSAGSPSLTTYPLTNEGLIVQKQTSPPDDPLGKYTVLLQDPLSEVTRKERRTLLGLSILSLAVVNAHLVPSEINALGMKISEINEKALVYILGAIVGYFIATFLAYAFPDFVIWKINLLKGMKATALEKIKSPEFDDANKAEQLANMIGIFDAKMSSWASWAGLISIVRVIFDFVLPALVGFYALYALVNYQPPIKALLEQPTKVLTLPPL
ncbi:MAG: hypothetical protein Q8L77_03220 [Nitrospirota bacterium]|nr:hypothetical protein [Nitrospirota bacterium]